MPSFALSVLDQSPIPEGSTAGDALRNSIDLARLADQLGYRRYWLAEHHGSSGLACASPEAIIGPVAAATSQIRVGSGGIMLPHYSPLKVAETFSMLSGLFPGRIDLGIGRAPGTSAGVAFALQRAASRRPMISGSNWKSYWATSAGGQRLRARCANFLRSDLPARSARC
jgi:luciferase family oxidoreductase group 1